MKNASVFLIFMLILIQFGITQNNIQKAIENLAKEEQLLYGEVGFAVVDMQTGNVVANYNANKSLIPASTLKAITTLTALQILGTDFRFKTELQYDGTIDANGILKGNLYIKGYGDPALGSDKMDNTLPLAALLKSWVEAIKKAGIRQIDGKIVGDASYFKGDIAGDTWQWYDLGNYYATGTWGLNVHENYYYLHFQQVEQLGATPPIAKIEPVLPNLYLINEVQSAEKGSGDNAYIYGGPYAYTRIIRGTIPVGNQQFTIRGSIPDPPFFIAHSLLYALEENNIKTTKQATTQFELNSNNARTTFYTHYSPPLVEIAQRANYESINLYCESLIRVLGAQRSESNTLKEGVNVIKDYWKNKGLNTDGWFLMDGSGLSSRNGITALQMAKILQLGATERESFKAFYGTLPVGGKSGTVQSLFQNTAAAGNIRLKSGSIERVRAYTGYARTKDGRMLAFSFLVNNYTGSGRTLRNKMEQVMVKLCE
jgi:D-alanyl-D-alanine carboxypeptidase/D-alanyl-D-alanine-endopeptidase (penicillin-binding protein 4)